MPELPEIETLKRSLFNRITNCRILAVTKFRESIRYNIDPKIIEKTTNTFIVNTRRIAKYLILELSNNYCLVFHLGMSGKLILKGHPYQFQKHDHIIFHLEDKNYLVFNDTRRFGMVYICMNDTLKLQKYLCNLGPDPLDKAFNVEYLYDKLKNKKTSIKTAIMDNRIMVGVGNIYASESLFLSNISPFKQAQNLTLLEVESLVKSIIIVLEKAILAGGTTLRDFVNGDNKPGYFKQQLNVYNRKDKACNICRTNIIKIIQNGRSTYYCQKCQHQNAHAKMPKLTSNN